MKAYVIEWTDKSDRRRRAFPAKYLAFKWAASLCPDTCGSVLLYTYLNAPDDLFDEDDVAALIWTRGNTAEAMGQVIFVKEN